MNKYTTLSHETKLEKGLELCKKLFLEEHPEMVGVPISKNKMLFEKIKFYLKGTKYYKEFMESVDNVQI